VLLMIVLRATAYACDPSTIPTHFELFDVADQVVIATPTSVPAKEVGDVTMRVDRALKGTAGTTVTTRLTGSDCDPHFVRGTQMIMFFANGEPLGLYFGPVATGKLPWLALLGRWAAATNDHERAGVAAAAIAAGGDVAADGISLLRRFPSITDALTDDQIARAVAAVPKLHGGLRGMLREVNNARLRKALHAAARKQ